MVYINLIHRSPHQSWQTLPIRLCNLSLILSVILLILLIVSSVKSGFSNSTVLFKSRCDDANQINTALRSVIIFISFLVTTSSDLFLRLVLAPHLEDIQKAHFETKWVDIGISSWRNLSYIPKWRRISWGIFIITSIPLQFFFNSAVFLTSTTTEYQQILVSQDFLTGGSWAVPGVTTEPAGVDMAAANLAVTSFQDHAMNNSWTRMNSTLCRKTYLQSDIGLQYYRNLIVVVETDANLNSTTAGWTLNQVWNSTRKELYGDTLNTLWSFGSNCRATILRTDNLCGRDLGIGMNSLDPTEAAKSPVWQYEWINTWYPGILQPTPIQHTVTAQFCVVEQHITPCSIQVTNSFLFMVFLCVLTKSTVAIFMLKSMQNSKPVQCLGDAIEVLSKQDETEISGLSGYDQRWFRNYEMPSISLGVLETRRKWTGSPKEWNPSPKRWGSAVPWTSWLTTYLIFAFFFVPILYFLMRGVHPIDVVTSADLGYEAYDNRFRQVGFGDNPYNPRLFLSGRVLSTLVGNLPLCFLTAWHFLLMTLVRRLFQSRQWARFSEGPQRLKVTVPDERYQEQNYSLFGVPLGWGLVFAVCSIALHFMASQSIYVVASEVRTVDGTPGGDPLNFKVEFSSEACLVSVVLGIFTAMIPVALSFRRLPPNSIVVGTNSAAISAHCHQLRKKPPYESLQHETREPKLSITSKTYSLSVKSLGAGKSGSFDDETRVTKLLTGDHGSIKPWLHVLQWGVLTPGTFEKNRPGQLGLAPVDDIISAPVEGHYYQ